VAPRRASSRAAGDPSAGRAAPRQQVLRRLRHALSTNASPDAPIGAPAAGIRRPLALGVPPPASRYFGGSGTHFRRTRRPTPRSAPRQQASVTPWRWAQVLRRLRHALSTNALPDAPIGAPAAGIRRPGRRPAQGTSGGASAPLSGGGTAATWPWRLFTRRWHARQTMVWRAVERGLGDAPPRPRPLTGLAIGALAEIR